MIQGNVVKHEGLMSNGKQLDYYLLRSDDRSSGEYAIAVLSRKDGKNRFAIVPQLTGEPQRAVLLFDTMVSGTVRPETLAETLSDVVLIK